MDRLAEKLMEPYIHINVGSVMGTSYHAVFPPTYHIQLFTAFSHRRNAKQQNWDHGLTKSS